MLELIQKYWILILLILTGNTVVFYWTFSGRAVYLIHNHHNMTTNRPDLTTILTPVHNNIVPLRHELEFQINPHHPTSYLDHIPVSDLWTNVTTSTLAYRVAHFDNRTGAFGGPVLVVLVCFDPRISKYKPLLNALIAYSNGTEIVLPEYGIYRTLRKPKPHEYIHGHLLLFRLPTNERPKFAFLCTKHDCSKKTAHLSVYRPKISDINKYNFTVCLHQPLFNHTGDHEDIVAWIEMNRALGAERIFIYYQEIQPDVMKIVQKYILEGFVEAFDWYNNFSKVTDLKFGQSIMIYDCFYRSLYTTKYLVLHDLDELLIPQNSSTWKGMIGRIGNTDSISSYRFCHSAFHYDARHKVVPIVLRYIKLCSNITKIPFMFTRTKRTARLNCKWTRWKNIIVPERIYKVGLHDMHSIDGYHRCEVPSTEGLLHHYRKNDTLKKERSINDYVMKKYTSDVISNVMKRLC